MTDWTRDAGEILAARRGAAAWITLNRPDRLNALAGTMREQLADAVTGAAADRAVRVIVVTGAGRGFCAGADVEVMARLLERGDAEGFAKLVRAGMRVVRAVRAASKPVVAAVNGVAAGAGASLAAACDLRIASDRAALGFTFNRIGLHPDWGATHFLPRLVGSGRAAELIHTARMVDAREAHDIGLFGRVVPAEEFEEAVATLARELASRPPLALARAKASLAAADGDLEAALVREEEAQLACFRSADAREGISAFLEKRTPEYRGE